MAGPLVQLQERPAARYIIAGWSRQWSDGGAISSALPQYLIDKLKARKIGEMTEEVSLECYPFQVAGTHDNYRPGVAYHDGFPSCPMYRDNNFYDAGNGLIIFLGEEPAYRVDIYAQAFFEAVKELGVEQTVTVEGYNGAAPPELERSVNCVYSQPRMRPLLERHGIGFSNYGSGRRSGPTIGMALVTIAHYRYPDIDIFRMGAMAPVFPFLTRSNEPVGISRDHRSFYDIMRRLNVMFKLDIDLLELKALADADCSRLQETLERISASSPDAKRYIEAARAEYSYTPFVEPVELDPTLDKALEDILRNAPEQGEDG